MTTPPVPSTLAAWTAFRRFPWLSLTVALTAVKLAWLIADHTPMLFLGDSESYLWTALTGWIPPDRSFLYGFLLRPLAVDAGSMLPLIAAQSASSVVVALLLAHLLAKGFAIRRRISFAVAVAWAALEPLALLYERSVMTEAFALVAFAAYVSLSIRYIMAPRLRDAVLAQAAATFVIAFRTLFVPISLLFALGLPVIALAGRQPPHGGASARRKLTLALLVSITATGLFHQAYRVANGWLSGYPAAYQYEDGFFLLATWSPVLNGQDFEDRSLGETILAESDYTRTHCYHREAQRWHTGCIVDRFQHHVGTDSGANAAARRVAVRALWRDPIGVARLALANWLGSIDPDRVRAAMRWDRGVLPFSPSLVELMRDRFGVAQAAELHRIETPTNRWYFAATPWIRLLALAPFISFLALAVCPAGVRRNMAFVTLLVTCIVGATAFGAPAMVPRYYHAVAWLTLIPLSVIGTWLGRSVHGACRTRLRAFRDRVSGR